MSLNALDIEQSRERIRATAKAMLSGACSFIEGSRRIVGLLHRARIDQAMEPFAAFVGIDSETDEVPVGSLRKGWHPEAKAKLQAGWEAAENYARTYGEIPCREAIDWIEQHPTYGG